MNENEETTGWTTTPEGRHFLARVAVSSGIPLDQVPLALGVGSVAEYTGSKLAAETDIRAFASEQRVRMLDRLLSENDGVERQHSEAPAVAWSEVYLPGTGLKVSVTARTGATVEEVILPIVTLAQAVYQLEGARVISFDRSRSRFLEEYVPEVKTRIDKPQPAEETPVEVDRQTAPPKRTTPKPPPAPPVEATHPDDIPQVPAKRGAPPNRAQAQERTQPKSGSGKLTNIEVRSNGHVEFTVQGLRFPLKEARGPEAAASLFDEELGWESTHFYPGASYPAEDLAGLRVYWEKPDKYYNVVRISAEV